MGFGCEGNYILFLGRLVPEKGCHYLLKAFETINTPMKLVIAGDSSHSDAYVARLKQIADSEVIFTGFARGDLLEELFSNAYAYVIPSELEGLVFTFAGTQLREARTEAIYQPIWRPSAIAASPLKAGISRT